MNHDFISQDVKLIIERHTGLKSIDETSRLAADLSLDSIDRMSMACDIEDTFGVLLGDDVVDELTDVASLIEAVRNAVSIRRKEPA